ncbi:MAG: hypothetical protein EOM50_13045 [Erysipelotrichia bacterium]|nr:hypothetical protein [Erysipelotrichia bacterium]
MSFQTEHQKKLEDLTYQLNNLEELRRTANGGNSILFTFPPKEEQEYIDLLHLHYQEKAKFIDISKLLISFIDSYGWEEFEELYKDLKSTPYLLFKSDAPEKDLFDSIIDAISEANNQDKIPILMRTGILCGTGIENQNIMEHRVVMALKHPLVILYPATFKNHDLMFLNFRPANKYRCTVVA